MMSAVENLGSQLNSSSLDNKIKSITFKNQKNKKSYLCRLDFNTAKTNIDIKFIEIKKDDNDDKIKKDYLWVGNLGGNKPQWHVTTDNLKYALNSLYVLSQKIGSETALKGKLSDIAGLYYNPGNPAYLKDADVNIVDKKYELKLNFTDEEKLLKQKDFYELVYKKFMDSTEEINGYYNEIVLYTIYIDGKSVAQDGDYRKMLIDSVNININDEGGFYDGTCFICGQDTKVTFNTKKFQFKYYNTDKVSFSSDLDVKNFKKNFSICLNCYNNIINGENYIFKYLNTSIGGIPVLIIPEPVPFNNNFQLDIEKVFKITNTLITKNNEIIRVEDQATEVGSYINLMFYRKSNNYFKIIDFIPEIPEARVIKISRCMYNTSSEFRKAFFEFRDLNINDLYKTVHLKVLKKDPENVKEALRILIDLFKLKPLDKNHIMKIYLNKIRNYYYDNKTAYSMNIIRMYAYIKFLENINLIEFNKNNKITGEIEMEDEKMESSLDFMKSIKPSEEGESLFYIGYAIRYVDMILFKNNIRSNPMLEKINYQGMGFKEVEKLMNQIDEKIKQYGIFNKDMSYAMYKAHSIMAKYSFDKSKWPLDDVTNVFLIMTGYSIEDEFRMEKNNNRDNGIKVSENGGE